MISAWLSSTEDEATSRVPEVHVVRAGHRFAPNPRLHPAHPAHPAHPTHPTHPKHPTSVFPRICHTVNVPLADSTNGIRAVLFDVDGTLVDTLAALIPGLADAFETYAGFRPSDAEILATVGMPLTVQMRRYQLDEPTPEQIEERVAYTIQRYELYKDREKPFGPAIQALIHLQKAGLKIGLVTSKNRQELELFLERFDAAAFVDVAICASDVEHPKPHAESALLACERLGVSPRETVFIGDSIFDIQCAKNAHLATAIAVTYGAGTTSALLAEAPDLVIETPEALLEWAHNLSKTPCLDARS